MTFTISRKVLAAELSLLSTVQGKRELIPILSSVRMDWAVNLTLTASSLDITLISEVELPAVLTPETDSFCLPLRELYRLVSLFENDDVTFTVDRDGKGAGRVLVQGGKSRHKLPYWESREFPEIDTVASPQTFIVEGGLIGAVTRCLPCTTMNDNAPAYQYGVQFEGAVEGLTLAATDGHRLGYETIKTTTPTFDTIVSGNGLRPLLSLNDGPITIAVSDSLISFQLGQRKLITRLIDGKFPNWRMIIPANPHTAQLNNEQIRAALKRVGVTQDDRDGTGMRFTVTSDSLTIDTNSEKGASEEAVEIISSLNGEPIVVGLNPDYLNSYLANAGETVVCQLKDGNSALMFTEPDSNFNFVVMTMRI